MAVRQATAAPAARRTAPPQPPALTEADVAAAMKLKSVMPNHLQRPESVRLKEVTRNIPAYDLDAGVYMLPGQPRKPLMNVFLSRSAPRPGGGGGGSSLQVLVDPSTNRFWRVEGRGLAGSKVYGPGKLPAEVRFQGTAYSAQQLRQLSDRAEAAT